MEASPGIPSQVKKLDKLILAWHKLDTYHPLLAAGTCQLTSNSRMLSSSCADPASDDASPGVSQILADKIQGKASCLMHDDAWLSHWQPQAV